MYFRRWQGLQIQNERSISFEPRVHKFVSLYWSHWSASEDSDLFSTYSALIISNYFQICAGEEEGDENFIPF